MNALIQAAELPALSPQETEAMNRILDAVMEKEKEAPAEIPTEHFLHAGCYVRTCLVKKGVAIVGVTIKVPTVVIVSGHCLMSRGGEMTTVEGYRIFKGGMNRRQFFVGLEDTVITMFYATEKTDLSACEEEFTDEFDMLLSRRKQ